MLYQLFRFFCSHWWRHKGSANTREEVLWSHSRSAPWVIQGRKACSLPPDVGHSSEIGRPARLQCSRHQRIKSVRSDSRVTSSALSHWYKSSQLPWHFAGVNQVARLSGGVLCQQQIWASWEPQSPPPAFSGSLGLWHPQNRINSNLVWSALQILAD